MTLLSLEDALPRFKTNEDRINTFTNGGDAESYTSSDNVQVPSIRKFLKDKNTEINTGAGSILSQAQNARDIAVNAKTDAAGSASSAATSRDQAAQYATYIKNNWALAAYGLGTGAQADIPLTIDPGSALNMWVNMGGIDQMISQDAYALVYSGGTAFARMTVPSGVPYEIRVGNATTVGVPSDGTVGTAKIAGNAVDLTKILDFATLTLLGRKSAGSGDPEFISPNDLRDLFLPNGAIIDRGFASYAANTALAVALPTDDTMPQITEGTEILKVTITPKKTTSRLRARALVIGSVNAADNWAAALFSAGGANALDAAYAPPLTANYITTIPLEWEWVPGVTTAIDVTVRAGSNPGRSLYLNGSANGRIFGGVSHCTLVVEEIKA